MPEAAVNVNRARESGIIQYILVLVPVDVIFLLYVIWYGGMI